MMIAFLRTIILYSLVIFAMRLMGKRQIGELQPSEVVVAIMISDLASVPMSDTAIPLANGIIPILTLIIAEVVISYINLKSEKMRNLVTGKPSVIIKNGIICQDEMLKSRYNLEDLLEDLRLKNYLSIGDVYMAMLETNGELTVIPKAGKRPLKAEDFQIPPNQETMPYVLVSDGKIRKNHLKESGFNIAWIEKQLKAYNIKSVKEVFLLTVDDEQNIVMQVKTKGAST